MFMSERLSALWILIGRILAQHRKCGISRGRPLSFIQRSAIWPDILTLYYNLPAKILKNGDKTQSRDDCSRGGKWPAPHSSIVSSFMAGLEWLATITACVCVHYDIFSNNYRGAGQEVGRSCIILEFKGRKIMVNILNFTRHDIFWY